MDKDCTGRQVLDVVKVPCYVVLDVKVGEVRPVTIEEAHVLVEQWDEDGGELSGCSDEDGDVVLGEVDLEVSGELWY